MTKIRYVRMYADPHGESHFSDEEAELKPVNFAPPAPPLNLSSPTPAKQLAFFEMPADWHGDWHPAPQRQFFVFLAGEVEAQVSDGEVRRFRPGNVLLMEDTTGKGHASRSVGGPAIAVVVPLTDPLTGRS
jgi:quercetin dioxygenase-like cupin family protein